LPIIYLQISIENLNHEQHRQSGHCRPQTTFATSSSLTAYRSRLLIVIGIDLESNVWNEWNRWNRFRSLMGCTHDTPVLDSQLTIDQKT
jgi:hypothetical protein